MTILRNILFKGVAGVENIRADEMYQGFVSSAGCGGSLERSDSEELYVTELNPILVLLQHRCHNRLAHRYFSRPEPLVLCKNGTIRCTTRRDSMLLAQYTLLKG